MARVPRLVKALIKRMYNRDMKYNNIVIRLQKHGEKGITDIEIVVDNRFFCIIEAKKGWSLPTLDQLKKYRERFGGYKRTKRMFLVLSDCTEEYFNGNLKRSIRGVPIKSISWHDVIKTINYIYHEASNKEKYLLSELQKYLLEEVQMENKESNWVYVVSLSNKTPKWSKISWRDVINKKRLYFYPAEKNWPKIPLNYMGFRYDGKLQSIHYVKSYEIVADMHSRIPEIKRGKVKNHYLLYLGEPFEPRKELPIGKIWSNGRLKCMLDTLFTCKSLKDACAVSKKRLKD
ncbi:hypothetical protein A3K48_02025 [candidate division WOR-1 bacterium RIFOXYA12_FULL_52_29]|uniref:Uncharacterized protein n=1 Tax=candidate division WOR-1 bacterium RIFOXYC12_FULL_54_18 TaxID=1802584 RepID=A0A1F4T4X7_UNCSA|nr:MAG: hypothetical protein A3K44_02025 [candidate division WOR-1 bacterium RIFOXYA2_FULL_51_19]OGC17357.1 MAG: hypothetical protein A3K48_02025 [candidate division WOR-1 bacterium RIFOXYA12_FULL_52_29]OGC26216.1 MAG: hypothetical protein A3K32_02020 [candidate division WOR-1 bacterium RIFOXYB2_FULL_45_9]OGC27774.1 MAG: hypothetical protein A3K49_02025 [candidate division WOR-1 bacterium RIFOXYC12_FULL_54_18]OGC29937.1 MAG: hypothetical protein A2346_04310 [candidate division WOR-1 bacterium R